MWSLKSRWPPLTHSVKQASSKMIATTIQVTTKEALEVALAAARSPKKECRFRLVTRVERCRVQSRRWQRLLEHLRGRVPSLFQIWCWQMRMQNRMKMLRARKRHWRRKSDNKLKSNWPRLSLPPRFASREHWRERKRLMRIISSRGTLLKNFSSWHASRLK